MSETLKPCPFCGSADVNSASIRDGAVVRCNSCMAQGPACFSPHASNKARDEWNTQLNCDRYRTVLNNIRTYYAKEFREGDKAYQVVPIIDDVLGSGVEMTNPDSLEKQLADAEHDIAEGFALVNKMETENNRLRKALEWYANANEKMHAIYDTSIINGEICYGKRARETLKPFRNAFDEPSAIEPFGDLGKE